MSNSLRPHGLQPIRLLCPWDFPGKSTGVGRHFLLPGYFPGPGIEPGLAHCRQTPGRSTTFQNKKVETKMVLLYMFTSCPPGLTEHHSPPLQAHLAHCRLPTHSPPTGCHSQSLHSVLGTRRRGGRRWWPPLCSALLTAQGLGQLPPAWTPGTEQGWR